MAVDDVVFRAKIPKTVVEALEAEDFSVFSSPTYAKSFLRQYSEFIGVDAEPWLEALEPAAYVGGDAVLQPMFEGGLPAPAAKRLARDYARVEESPVTDGSGKWSALWLMVMTAGIVIGIIKGYEMFDKKFSGEEAPVTRAEAPVPAPVPKAGESQPPAQPATTGTADVSAQPAEEKKEEPSRPPRAIIVRD